MMSTNLLLALVLAACGPEGRDSTLRPVAELDREIQACEEQERVDLPEEGWCSGFDSNNRGEEADAMRFSFSADAPGGDPDWARSTAGSGSNFQP